MKSRHKIGAVILMTLLLAIVLVLIGRGQLWTFAPHAMLRWWAVRVVPLGTPYEETRLKIIAHGWHESSISGSCADRPGLGDWTVTAEVGQFLVEYTYVTYHFDAQCRLSWVEVHDEADMP